MSFALVVHLKIKPDSIDKFMNAVKVNGKATRETEPGCRAFEILQDPNDPTKAMLYEVYDDRAAFDAHLASGHYQRFDAAVADMVTAKSVRLLERAAP